MANDQGTVTTNPPQPQMTRAQFAASLKAKYPKYRAMSDDDLVKAVLAKAPVWEKMLVPANGAPVAPKPATETNPTTGITTPAGTMGSDNDSVLGGGARRLGDTIAGMYHTVSSLFSGPTTPEEEKMDPRNLLAHRVLNIGKGVIDQEKEAGSQAATQAREGVKGIQGGYPGAGAANLARSVVTGLSMLDPLATPSVTNVNRLVGQGRNDDAIGQGAVDILMLAAGGRNPKSASAASRINKLVSAGGEQAEMVKNLTTTLPELREAAADTGRTSGNLKISDYHDIVDKAGAKIDQKFNQALYPIGSGKVMPAEISQRIMAQITPDMKMTVEGRAEAAALRNAALEYQRPWTFNQLNAKRMTNNSRLTSFYNKGSQGASAALTGVQVKILKAVRDGAADIVYDAVDKANPGANARLLKQKQGALWTLRDQLADRVDQLENAEAGYKGKTLRQTVSPNAVVSSSGAHGYVRGISKLIPGGGPATQAAKQVSKAFKEPGTAALLRRRAILALPASALQGASDEQ